MVYKMIFTGFPVSGSKPSDLVVNGQVADLAGSSDMEIGGDTGMGRKLMKYHCVYRYYWDSEMVWNTPQGCASKGVRELGYLSSNPCSSLVDSCSWGVSSPALLACPACRLRTLLQPEQGPIQGLQWEAARRNGEHEWDTNRMCSSLELYYTYFMISYVCIKCL